MKLCPECAREYDNSMTFCLDDGAELLYGPASMNEPKTAILHTPDARRDEQTRGLSGTTDQTPVMPTELARSSDLAVSRRNSIIAGMVGVVLVSALGVGTYLYYGRGSSKQIRSIAVMPFVNDSGNADMDYLSDGMTETLIRSLSQLPSLNVKSRSSVFRYKGRETDAKTVGKELGVQAVLNGRVAQRGRQLTLSLELINAEDENVIWTDQYDRTASDLVSLQSEIARDVSNNLRLKLTSGDNQKIAKNYTLDPEVYRLYLQGRFYWNKRTRSEVQKAVGFFQQAVAKDPNFALGYVGLADSFEDEDRPQKIEYIRRALEIDPNLAEAHASLGYQLMCRQDWVESERELKRAAELNPNYAPAYAWNGMRFTMIGKYEEAFSEIDRALELDPTANGINFYKGVTLAVSGRREEAVQYFKKLQQMDPTFPWAHSFLSRIYFWNGDRNGVVEERSKAVELDGKPDDAERLRRAFRSGGWDAFQLESKRQSASGTSPFSLEAGRDDQNDDVIRKLSEKVEKGDFWLFLIKTDPLYDFMRNDPRFQEIARRFDPPQ